MSYQKYKTDSYCVGGRHKSATTKIVGGIPSKGSKVLIGNFSIRNRRKSMTVSDNTTAAEKLGGFLKSLGKKGLNASKDMTKKFFKNTGTTLEVRQNFGTTFASRSPKAASTTLPDVINSYHMDKRFFVRMFV